MHLKKNEKPSSQQTTIIIGSWWSIYLSIYIICRLLLTIDKEKESIKHNKIYMVGSVHEGRNYKLWLKYKLWKKM